MKNLTKLILLFAFIAIPIVAKSQVFSATEFVDLAYKSPEKLKSTLEAKGYSFSTEVNNDMSRDQVYLGEKNMSVSIIVPTFEDGQSLLSWEFVGLDNVYANLQQQLASAGYKKLENEVRSGSRYISTTYQKPGMTVTLSRDKIDNPNGLYSFSARYSSAAWNGTR